MSRAGNQEYDGSVRVEVIAGPDVQFIDGSNSGLFASIDYNGVGDYTLHLNRPVPVGGATPPTSGTTIVQAQIEGAVVGNITTFLTDETTLEVRTFDTTGANGGNAPADRPFNVRLQGRFFG